ncbi:MAG: phosphotransferase, partial [Gemmatimonadales bacterium]|nr:phosphotransferase [Gemmatimonadales bacterium]
GVRGCFALEVYNTGCDLEVLRGFSTVQWDDLLTLGQEYGGVAVDDGHSGAVDHGLGWTMIRSQELSAEAIMEALRRGLY